MLKRDDLEFLGIGLGPFNLSLAALADPFVAEVPHAFLEKKTSFDWHPGMILPGTTLQVPFLADFVSMVAPTSRYSFLNYLHEHGRLYHFYFHESFHIPRAEYQHYGQWVSSQLVACRFGAQVDRVAFDGERFVVSTGTETLRAKKLVVGVGSKPWVPACVREHLGPKVFHSAHFASGVAALHHAKRVAIIGSGQSAAECALHLLQENVPGRELVWYTRTDGFQPMEYSKLGLAQYFSPGYRSFFFQLAPEKKSAVLRGQDQLFKGISATTIAAIYDALYEATVGGRPTPLTLCPLQELVACRKGAQGFELQFRNKWTEETSELAVDGLVLGTGYRSQELSFLDDLGVKSDAEGRPIIDEDFRLAWEGDAQAAIYIQNAELHTHGVGAPDLGLGADRAARILNSIMNCEVYRVRDEAIFHQFQPRPMLSSL